MQAQNNFDPRGSIRRIEKLMQQLKMNEDLRKPNDYHHGMIDGLGNALTIIKDEIKAQTPRELFNPQATTNITDKTKRAIPWECWWSPSQTDKSA